MPAVMTVISSERVSDGHVRANGERSFGLAHENTGGNVQRFRPARAHADHDLGHLADDELHHAVVIEHGEERRDENHRGQNLEGEDHSQRSALSAQFAEYQLRAGEGILQKLFDAVSGKFQQIASKVEAQHEEGKQELQKSPRATVLTRIARRLLENK